MIRHQLTMPQLARRRRLPLPANRWSDRLPLPRRGGGLAIPAPLLTLIAGAGLGAGLTFLLDPNRGRRRRALIGDQAFRSTQGAPEILETTSRDVLNRSRGLFAGLGTRFRPDDADDSVVEARVRSRLGRVVAHPHAIGVRVIDGQVTLTGPVLTREVNGLLGAVAGVRGVCGVDNRLEIHDYPGNVPGLQGGTERPAPEFEPLQKTWSPAFRLVAGLAGGGLAVYGVIRRDWIGAGLGLGGLLLGARAVTNLEFKQLAGRIGGRPAPAETPGRFEDMFDNDWAAGGDVSIDRRDRPGSWAFEGGPRPTEH